MPLMTLNWKPFLALIGILLLVWILSTSDLNAIWERMKNAQPQFLALAIGTTILTLIGKGAKWRLLFADKKSTVSLVETTEIFCKGFFLSMMTPGRVGDFARALFVKKKVGLVFGLATILLDRLMDIVLLILVALIGLVLFSQLSGIWVINPLFLIVILAALGIGLWYVLQDRKQGFFRRFIFLLIPEKYNSKIRQAYQELIATLRDFQKHPKTLLAAFLLGIVNWILAFFTSFFVGSALGIDQSIFFFGIVISIMALVELIPISIGGIGTREATAIVLFSVVGLSAETAVAFSLTYFAIGYVLVVLLGGVLFIRKPVAI